jgi:dienelactone hydrolase
MSATVKMSPAPYAAAGRTLKSEVAVDAARAGKRPGVVVFPEWWGLNDYIRGRARQLAELGYVALAADVYGNGQLATNPNDAAAAMNALTGDPAALTAVIEAAVRQLAAHPDVDASRLGAMGYCLGGTLSVHAARIGLDLRGVVSFHGTLSPTVAAKRGDVKAKVLVCHGGDDGFITPEQEAAFRNEMKDLGVDLKFVTYPGAKHGFTNRDASESGRRFGIPLEYDAAADRGSWEEMKAFWERVFA